MEDSGEPVKAVGEFQGRANQTHPIPTDTLLVDELATAPDILTGAR